MPTAYAYRKYGIVHSSLDEQDPYHWSDSSICNMLGNEMYLGNTINMRFSRKSYKNRRKIEHPREECLVFENTHPALVTKEIWDIVQRVRQNKYSGLVVCADCGAAMVLHRAHTMDAAYSHFTCRTYKKYGAETCTGHYIRECVLDEVILEDLRRVTAMAREHTQEFAEYISGRQSSEAKQEIRRLERELTAVRKRSAELDAIFKKLYEDRVLGHISVEQFQMLSAGYTEEQAKLTEEIPAKEAAIQKMRDTVSSTDGFIAKAKRYTDITELTPELLRLFGRSSYMRKARSGQRTPCKPLRSTTVTSAGLVGRFRRTRKAPGRKSQRDSCRGTSSVKDTPVRGHPRGRTFFARR